MPPDKGGSNRFKDLEDEMTAKPKRPRRYNATSDFFGPTPCEVNNIHQWGADPKYLLLEFVNKEKKLTSINPFLIVKTLENITKTIKTFKPTRDGKYLILVPNLIEAEKVKGAFKEVLGEKVTAVYHDKLNSSKGTIRAPLLRTVSEKELLEGLKEANSSIVDAKHLTRKVDGATLNTGTIKLTFSTLTPPKYINVLYERVEVKRWYPSPLRCRNCYQFRHHESNCKQTPRCPNCNAPKAKDDTEHRCEKIYCISCDLEGHHTTLDRNCPVYLREKDIVKLQTDCNLSRFEARRRWFADHGDVTTSKRSKVSVVNNPSTTNNSPINGNATYSQVLKSLPTPATNTLTTNNAEKHNIKHTGAISKTNTKQNTETDTKTKKTKNRKPMNKNTNSISDEDTDGYQSVELTDDNLKPKEKTDYITKNNTVNNYNTFEDILAYIDTENSSTSPTHTRTRTDSDHPM